MDWRRAIRHPALGLYYYNPIAIYSRGGKKHGIEIVVGHPYRVTIAGDNRWCISAV